MKANPQIDKILSSFSNNKFRFLPRKNIDWDKAYEKCKTKLVYYSSNYIDFRFECFIGNSIECKDFSFGVELDKEIVALIPLFYFQNNKKNKISFLEDAISPPIFINNISQKLEKEISSILVEKLKLLYGELKSNDIVIIDQIYPSNKLSIWHKTVLEYTKKCNVLRELFVNLELDYKQIRANYRKSYKSLISKGYKIFKPYKYKFQELNSDLWNEFKELHFKSAGKKTRSEQSWDLLYEDLNKQKSNFYFCRGSNNSMVGGSLIMKSKFEAVYAIAAYDRELFHLPIGHMLQDYIISDLIKTDLKWYRLGRFYRNSDFDKPTEKEIQIAKFKSGFSTDTVATFRFSDLKL